MDEKLYVIAKDTYDAKLIVRDRLIASNAVSIDAEHAHTWANKIGIKTYEVIVSFVEVTNP